MTLYKSHALLIKPDATVIVNCKRERDNHRRNRKVLEERSDIFAGKSRTL